METNQTLSALTFGIILSDFDPLYEDNGMIQYNVETIETSYKKNITQFLVKFLLFSSLLGIPRKSFAADNSPNDHLYKYMVTQMKQKYKEKQASKMGELPQTSEKLTTEDLLKPWKDPAESIEKRKKLEEFTKQFEEKYFEFEYVDRSGELITITMRKTEKLKKYLDQLKAEFERIDKLVSYIDNRIENASELMNLDVLIFEDKIDIEQIEKIREIVGFVAFLKYRYGEEFLSTIWLKVRQSINFLNAIENRLKEIIKALSLTFTWRNIKRNPRLIIDLIIALLSSVIDILFFYYLLCY